MTSELLTTNFLRARRGAQIRDDERAALEACFTPTVVVSPRSTVVRAGDIVDFSTLLVDGFMCRYMDDRAGHRQLVALHLPGDFVDLHAFPLKKLDHDVATLTQCRIATVPHERLAALTTAMPHLTRMLWFSTLLDAAMHREWIFRLGRLDAAGRLAHFMLESERRLRAIGMSDGETFRLPLTQADLAEACGLTAIHVNRVLRDLREAGLLIVEGGLVRIVDGMHLKRIAEFDDAYLYYDEDAVTP